MANAGCINAIGFDGTLIQTLQQLDSSNIGVGVQYCAPNPLDDKRFDYIKYTDKCGCTCCLTGENEIMIYATQGVIKNLTLTNDDTNEVVNVKRTDLFGSNRKKTVVRYKTGSYPTSITDGTLAVEETTMNQYQTNGYNVSGLSDATTYYFTAFAVAQDDTIIVVQSGTVETNFGRKPGVNTLAYWNFDDRNASQITDATGNGNNLTGSIPTYAQLSGTDYYGIFASNKRGTRNRTLSGNFTILMYVQLRSSSSQYLLQINSSNEQLAFIYGYKSGEIEIFQGNRFTIKSSTPINTRMLIGMTKNGNTVKGYFNGQYVSSASQSHSTRTNIFLGGSIAGDYANSYINNVIIEQGSRSDSDFASYRNKTKGKYGLT